LVVAATASGKTEAVIAPLLERRWRQLRQPGLHILYICPTRALVRDLYERLQPALADSGIALAMKTGDVAMPRQTPALLITTPESTDALLTRSPKLFRTLQAIVLDEIHLFDNTPRGDHVRCLLNRISRIQQYGRPDAPLAQRVALSATVPDAAGVAQRYLRDGVIVEVAGGRTIEAEIRPLYDLTELVDALGQRPSRKTLIFCNTRAEVEQTAAYLRQHLPHHADIFVHYSNLDGAMRTEVETRFAAAATAVCVSTSTLELGIDIGSVDDVALLGAPLDLTSFLQRIGRGSRRTQQTRVLCLPKSPYLACANKVPPAASAWPT
jgi:ATP-dependent helicase Lhr and Lhr-like helicase